MHLVIRRPAGGGEKGGWGRGDVVKNVVAFFRWKRKVILLLKKKRRTLLLGTVRGHPS